MNDSQINKILLAQLDVNLELMGTITAVIGSLNLSEEDQKTVFGRLSSAAEKNAKLIKHMQALLSAGTQDNHGL